MQQQHFPDEGPLNIEALAVLDPFAPLWQRIIPSFLKVYQSLLGIWRPEQQAILLRNRIQRYTYAISDDEVFVSRSQTNDKSGGVFGEGGTAGSVVAGVDRRDCNLVPKWSGWLNELRNTCFQMFGLLAKGRALFAPELATFYPSIVSALIDPVLLKSMEHRQLTQFLKHVPEVLLTSCPSTLYATHLGPILGPLMEHVRFRLEHTWSPILSAAAGIGTASSNVIGTEAATRAVTSNDATRVAELAARSCVSNSSSGSDEWFAWYYGHAGLFVGDLDLVTAEAVVEKHRVDVSHAFVDMVQVALALKGDWALVLANQAKEEQATKRNDASKLMSGPASSITDGSEVERNANGTAKHENQAAIDARKLQRIDAMAHFMTVIQCLGYPDAYTVRRTTKVCHRIIETVAWSPHYAELIGDRMFRQVLKNIVTEPKWMVGIEWDMINVMRDIYCRCVLGQTVQTGGQGAALQQPSLSQNYYEQAKTVSTPFQGGGILQYSSDSPRRALTSIPGITMPMVEQFESDMKSKRSAKDQKDFVRDLLRIASDNVRELTTTSMAAGGGAAGAASIFDRAQESESFLASKGRPSTIPALPEKLVTQSQIAKKKSKAKSNSPNDHRLEGLAAFDLF
jgi:Exportin-5 family